MGRLQRQVLEALLEFFLLGRLSASSLNLVCELKLRSGREILDVVAQVVRRRQRLSSDCCLTTGKEGT